MSPTFNPTRNPTLYPTFSPTANPTFSPTQEYFPTARIRTVLQRPAGNTVPDDSFEHAIQCFFNFLFSKLNGRRYRWKSDLPIDYNNPGVLIPRVSVFCDVNEPTGSPTLKTVHPSLSPSQRSPQIEDSTLTGSARELNDFAFCSIEIEVHLSNTPTNVIFEGDELEGEAFRKEKNKEIVEAITFLEALGSIQNSPLNAYFVADYKLLAGEQYEVSIVEDTPRSKESDFYCSNSQMTYVGSAITSAPVIGRTIVPTSPTNSELGNSLIVVFLIAISAIFGALLLLLFQRQKKKREQRTRNKKPSWGMSFSESNDIKSVFHRTLKEFQETDGLRIDMKSLKLERPIGHGANGRIFKARYAGSQAAVKEIYAEQLAGYFETGQITEAGNKKLQAVLREVKLLRMLRHPHIIQLFGCSFSKTGDTGVWRFLMVMELAACSLFDILERPDSLRVKALPPLLTDEQSTISFAKEICSGIAYIHDNKMVHFDIKPANILVDFSGHAKICDLGIAKITGAQNEMERTQTGLGGTPPYMAPELLQGIREVIGQPVDVYAFGILFWQLFHKQSPQPIDWTIPQLFQQVLLKDFRPPIDPNLVNSYLKEIMEKCWDKNHKNRPTFNTLLNLLSDYQNDQARKSKAALNSFNIGDEAVVWNYRENDYVPCIILNKSPIPGDEGSFVYSVQMSVSGEIVSSVLETNILPRGASELSSTFRTVGKLALKNASKGRTLRVITPSSNEVSGMKTYSLNAGNLEMQGMMFSQNGVRQLNKGNLAVSKDLILKLDFIGQGASGAVFSALYLENYSMVAVKEVRIAEKGARHQIVRELSALWKNLIDESMMNTTQTVPSYAELCALPNMKCPYIVGFYGAFFNEVKGTVSIVMEYMDGGSLEDILRNESYEITSPTRRVNHNSNTHTEVSTHDLEKFSVSSGIVSEEILASITKNILQALVFIHNMKFIHLDIKPANILINVFGQAKLADFGLAKQLEESKDFRARTFVGTMRYMSPERINAEEYGCASDIWSLGITLLTVALGKFPMELDSISPKADENPDSSRKSGSSDYWKLLNLFRNRYTPELPQKVIVYEETSSGIKSPLLHEFSFEFQTFIASCLRLEQNIRPTALKLLNHPWFNDFEFNHIDVNQPHNLPPNLMAMKREQLNEVLEALLQDDNFDFSTNLDIETALSKTFFLPLQLVRNEIFRVLPVRDANFGKDEE